MQIDKEEVNMKWNFWREHFPISREILIILGLLITVCLFEYGFKITIIYSSLILSAISDGILISSSRTVIFHKNYTTKYVQNEKKVVTICFILSVVLHSIAYHFIGKNSFILVPPTIILLALIYLMYWVNKKRVKK